MVALEMPRNLVGEDATDAVRRWVPSVPRALDAITTAWGLTVEAPFQPGGRTAWVAPARLPTGEPCVVKLAFVHPEATNEADGLRAWQGAGAVRLLDAADLGGTAALLLERCDPGSSLAEEPEPVQDEVIAGLLRRLWIEPPPAPPFRTLRRMCDEWADGFEARAARHPPDLDPGLVRVGIALLRELPATAPRTALLCTDLHAANVLAARREPWLVIDPKPHVGDPTYDVVQHLLNCPVRLRADPLGLCRRLADLAELDADRVERWLFARCVQEAPTWAGLAEVARQVAPR